MALQIEPVHFQLRNTAGTQVITLADATFVVKAFIPTNVLYGSSASPDPTFAHTTNPGSVGNFSLGLDDGVTAGCFAGGNQLVFGGDLGNYGTSNAYSISAINAIPILINARPFLARIIDKSTPGQFTIEVAFSSGGNVWIEGFVVGGSDIEAKVVEFGPGGVGSFAVPVGFEAKAAIAIGFRHVSNSDLRSGGGWVAGFGWSVKCDGKGSCTSGADAGNFFAGGGVAVAASYQRSDRLCALVDPNGAGSVPSEIAVSAWDPTSVQVESLAYGAPTYYKILFLGGAISANAGTFTQGDTSIPYRIKRPKGMLVASIGKVAGTSVRRDAFLMFGMMTNPAPGKFNTSNVNHATFDNHNLGVRKGQDLLGTGVALEPVATCSSWEITGGASNVFPEDGVLKAHGLVTSLDSQNAPASWTINDGVLREHAYLLLGDDLTGGLNPCGDSDEDDCPDCGGGCPDCPHPPIQDCPGCEDCPDCPDDDCPDCSGGCPDCPHPPIQDCPGCENCPDCVTDCVIEDLDVGGATVAVGVLDVAFSTNVTASGGVAPYTFAIVAGALPPGVTLNGSSGAITGQPTSAGRFAVTVRVTDANGTPGFIDIYITIAEGECGETAHLLTAGGGRLLFEDGGARLLEDSGDRPTIGGVQ